MANKFKNLNENGKTCGNTSKHEKWNKEGKTLENRRENMGNNTNVRKTQKMRNKKNTLEQTWKTRKMEPWQNWTSETRLRNMKWHEKCKKWKKQETWKTSIQNTQPCETRVKHNGRANTGGQKRPNTCLKLGSFLVVDTWDLEQTLKERGYPDKTPSKKKVWGGASQTIMEKRKKQNEHTWTLMKTHTNGKQTNENTWNLIFFFENKPMKMNEHRWKMENGWRKKGKQKGPTTCLKSFFFSNFWEPTGVFLNWAQ